MQSSNLGERLRQERTRLGLSQAAFGDAGGVKKFAQSNYENGKRHPDALYLESVSKIGADIQYIVTGVHSSNSGSGEYSEALRIEDGSPVGLSSPSPSADAAPVPMYDIEAAAGAGRFLDEEPVKTTLYFPADQLSSLGLSAGRVAGVQVRGDSMESTLEDGDWVLVNLGDTDYRQEGVFLLLISGERRIKRVQRLAGGALYLISDNDHYRPEMIPPDQMSEVEILGRCVVRIGRIS